MQLECLTFCINRRNQSVQSTFDVRCWQNEGGREGNQGCPHEEHDEPDLLVYHGNHSQQREVSLTLSRKRNRFNLFLLSGNTIETSRKFLMLKPSDMQHWITLATACYSNRKYVGCLQDSRVSLSFLLVMEPHA